VSTPDFEPPPAPAVKMQLAALRAAFPAYRISLIKMGGKCRFEAVRRDGGTPYCLISADAKEIWAELKATAAL
jgi:hypothetical protein